MATAPNDRARDAHYHPVKATQKWAEFIDAMLGVTADPPEQRAAKAAKRKRETTYHKGILGKH